MLFPIYDLTSWFFRSAYSALPGRFQADQSHPRELEKIKSTVFLSNNSNSTVTQKVAAFNAFNFNFVKI